MVAALQANPAGFEEGIQAMLDGDFAIAYCHWKPLADRGYAEAQYNIGWLYANGNGLNLDVEKALDWWLQAASQGHADAQFAVALAYMTGEGIDKNIDEAFRWYLVAAHQGHGDARDVLARLALNSRYQLIEKHPELLEETWFGQAASIKGDRINLRSGPGTNFDIVHTYEGKGKFRLIAERNDWALAAFELNGDISAVWVYRPLIQLEASK